MSFLFGIDAPLLKKCESTIEKPPWGVKIKGSGRDYPYRRYQKGNGEEMLPATIRRRP
jgi:hypothetical protein